MIARIIILLILLIVLPDAWFAWRNRRRRKAWPWWRHALCALPSAALVAYAVWLATGRDFAPADTTWLNLFLLLLGAYVLPRVVYVACSAVGLLWCRLRGSHRNWGNLVGFVLGAAVLYIIIYGATLGTRQVVVRQVDVASPDVPAAFDGYRLVHFSDLHVGTLPTGMLDRVVDSILAQKPRAIVFTGDLQNMRPEEMYPHLETLRRLHAPDGVYSILGNHDYSYYLTGTPDAIRAANDREVVACERQCGWQLLQNERRVLRCGADSIVVAGEENDGKPPFPQHGDLGKTLAGVAQGAFTILLQHDPSAWRRTILPHSHAQLTLSGHTHGGQLSLFGWRPTMLTNTEDRGLYEEQGRTLYVTSGVGGFLPFRFNMPPEIIVITLHRTH